MYPHSSPPVLPARLIVRCLALLLLAGFVAAGIGCTRDAKDSVSGFVTLNGKPVTGNIQFISGSKESPPSPIGPKGDYTVINPPKGECDVVIKGLGAVAGPVKDAKPMGDKDAGSGIQGPGEMAAQPPQKYASRGVLKFTVEGGKQKKDFELTP